MVSTLKHTSHPGSEYEVPNIYTQDIYTLEPEINEDFDLNSPHQEKVLLLEHTKGKKPPELKKPNKH